MCKRLTVCVCVCVCVCHVDDPMYPAGLLITLERLLDTIDQLRAGKSSLASIVAATAAAEAGGASKKKNMVG